MKLALAFCLISSVALAQTQIPGIQPSVSITLSGPEIDQIFSDLQESVLMYQGPDKAWRPLTSSGAEKVMRFLHEREIKEQANAKPKSETSQNNGGGIPQPTIREENRNSDKSREGIQPSR